ncbi:MAG: hypothetical protein ACOYK8_00210 [Alphaproteobacteria bacterium]
MHNTVLAKDGSNKHREANQANIIAPQPLLEQSSTTDQAKKANSNIGSMATEKLLIYVGVGFSLCWMLAWFYFTWEKKLWLPGSISATKATASSSWNLVTVVVGGVLPAFLLWVSFSFVSTYKALQQIFKMAEKRSIPFQADAETLMKIGKGLRLVTKNFDDTVGRHREHIDGSLQKLETRLKQLEGFSAQSHQATENSFTVAEKRCETLVDISEKMALQLKNRQETIEVGMSNVEKLLNQALLGVEQRIDSIESKILKVQEKTRNTEALLDQVSDRTEKRLMRVSDLSSSIQMSMDTTSARLVHQINSFDTVIRKGQEAIKVAEQQMNAEIARLSEGQDQKLKNLEQATDLYLNSAHKIREELTSATPVFEAMEKTLSHASVTLNKVSQESSEMLNNLQQTSEQQSESLKNQLNSVSISFGLFSDQLNDQEGRYHDLAEKLIQTATTADAKFTAFEQHLQTQAQAIQQGIEDWQIVQEKGGNLAEKAANLQQHLQSRFSEMLEKLDLFSSQINQALSGTEKLLQDYNGTTNIAEEQYQRFLNHSAALTENTLKAKEELTAFQRTLQQSLTQVENTPEQLQQIIKEIVSNIDNHSNNFTSQINILSDKSTHLSAEMEKHCQQAGNTIIKTNELQQNFEAMMAEFIQSSAVIVENSTKTTHTIKDGREQLEELYLQWQQTDAEKLSWLQDNISKAGEQLEKTESYWQAVKEIISRTGSFINNQTDKQVSLLRDTEEKITSTLGLFDDSAHAVIGKLSNTIQSIEEQKQQLARISEDASETTFQIRNAEIRARRDAFLSSAKFVIETLHSLSGDLSKYLETNIPAKVWKSYMKGETGLFTHRLYNMREYISADRLITKFENDNEFREAVNRYIRLFEELFDQAMRSDQGDLLSATLMSSDVGKVYFLLSSSLGRERINEKNKVTL